MDASEDKALQGIGHRLQVPLGQMKVLGGGFQITVTQQNLDGAQISASLEQVGRPTVAQRMWSDPFAQPCLTSRLPAGDPDGLVRDGLFGPAPGIAAGKQVGFRLAPTPVFPRRIVAKGDFHFGELFPRVGFIVTNLETGSQGVVRFYHKRGTA